MICLKDLKGVDIVVFHKEIGGLVGVFLSKILYECGLKYKKIMYIWQINLK